MLIPREHGAYGQLLFPVVSALLIGRPSAAAYLFAAAGAAVDTQDRRGVGVLHACALHGLLGCARLLKAHGASVDQVDAFGRTAADVAALLGYVDVAAELGMPHPSRIPGVRQTLRRPARAPD